MLRCVQADVELRRAAPFELDVDIDPGYLGPRRGAGEGDVALDQRQIGYEGPGCVLAVTRGQQGCVGSRNAGHAEAHFADRRSRCGRSTEAQGQRGTKNQEYDEGRKAKLLESRSVGTELNGGVPDTFPRDCQGVGWSRVFDTYRPKRV